MHYYAAATAGGSSAAEARVVKEGTASIVYLDHNLRRPIHSSSSASDMHRGRSPLSTSSSQLSPRSSPSSPTRQHYDFPATPAITPPKPYLPLRARATESLRTQHQPRAPYPRYDNNSEDRAVSPLSLHKLRSQSPAFAAPARPNSPRLQDARSHDASMEQPRGDAVAHAADLPSPTGRMRGQTFSQMQQPTARMAEWPLKAATSIPDLRGSQSAARSTSSSIYRPERGPVQRQNSRSSLRKEHNSRRRSSWDDSQTGLRSTRTTSSSYNDASVTERSSIATKDTSLSDITQPTSVHDQSDEEGMSVEDAISMYAQGFTDDPQRNTLDDSPADSGYYSQFPPAQEDEESLATTAQSKRRKSQSDARPPEDLNWLVQPNPDNPKNPLKRRSVSEIPASSSQPRPRSILKAKATASRDRYGFKKATQHITEEEYNAWNSRYEQHLDRRRRKWVALMKQHGLPIDNPTRFPPRSDKVKRYIRKGIPPEWRGEAWFWYAGGPVKIQQRPGLYPELLRLAEEGSLSEHDRDQLERDLNRTFPDNIKFRPDVFDIPARMSGSYSQEPEQEPPIIQSLRRVLTAFAVNNPSIGYCQSLNFLAGLLLLFLDLNEEKSFILLSILCNEHLPGAHGRILEASVEVGVFMSCIRDTMPAIWERIDDQPQIDAKSPPGGLARLPTVSLATTAWFMSCFVSNLPTESVLRVWDCLFYEGSKTLFRIGLTIFKLGEPQIRAVNEHLEIFQVVQQIPRQLIDPNVLLEACYKRRNGFGHLSQNAIDQKRAERRAMVKDGAAARLGKDGAQETAERESGEGARKQGTLRRAASKAKLKRSLSRKRV